MITKEDVVDKIEISEDGVIHVRTTEYFVEDGKRLGVSERGHHREAIEPGDAARIASYGGRVADIAGVVWTAEVVAARQERVAAFLRVQEQAE